MKRKAILLLLLAFFSFDLFAVRNEIERFILVEDKVDLDEINRRFGHDWIVDINGAWSNGVLGVIEDGADVADGTNAQILSWLNSHKGIEKFIGGEFGANIPLPQFDYDGMTFYPSLRTTYTLGGQFSINSYNTTVTYQNISISADTPFVQLYLKSDFKYGANVDFDWKKNNNNFFGGVYLYKMDRWDRYEGVDATTIFEQKKIIQLDKPKNTTSFLTTDLWFGVKKEKWKAWAALEELDLFKISSRSTEGGGNISYKIKQLFKVHADYKYDREIMKFRVFGGLQYRSEYSPLDGIYVGGEVFAGDFPLSAQAIIDNEFLSLNPRIRWGFFQLEYTAKLPLKSDVDGFDTSLIHDINLRLTF